MTRIEAETLAEELARESSEVYGDPMRDGWWGDRVTRETRIETLILRALGRVLTPTRIEAAERAVLTCAEEWRRLDIRRHGLRTQGEQQRLDDLIRLEAEALDRLRDLREQIGVEECGALAPDDRGDLLKELSDRSFNAAYPEKSRAREYFLRLKKVPAVAARCHLPRGHEGEHEGALGIWRWV